MNAHQSLRRRCMGLGAVLLALPVLGRLGVSRASTASKEAFHYQDHPNDGHRCAGCAQFIPPAAGEQAGGCQIVAGAISANGWCMAFDPRKEG
jgi:hypothetical protein